MNDPRVQDVITLVRQLERKVKTFPKGNWTATADPTATDDADLGYAVGSWWYRPDLNKLWICSDATMGAAVWNDAGGGGGSGWLDGLTPLTVPEVNADGTAFQDSAIAEDADIGCLNVGTQLNTRGVAIQQPGSATIFTTDGGSISTIMGRVSLGSDSEVPTDRTFTIGDGLGGMGLLDGFELRLQWTTGRGQLVASGNCSEINGDWLPEPGDILQLQWDSSAGKWIELWRYPGPVGVVDSVSNKYYALKGVGGFGDGQIFRQDTVSESGTKIDDWLITAGLSFISTGRLLNSDDITISPVCGRYILISDDATASNRTFHIGNGPGGNGNINDGWLLELRWSGVNAGELLSSDSNLVLSADWTPSDGGILMLEWDATSSKWRELWRYPIPSASSGIETGTAEPSTETGPIYLRSDTGIRELWIKVGGTWELWLKAQ